MKQFMKIAIALLAYKGAKTIIKENKTLSKVKETTSSKLEQFKKQKLSKRDLEEYKKLKINENEVDPEKNRTTQIKFSIF